jgi:hypothetical protein
MEEWKVGRLERWNIGGMGVLGELSSHRNLFYKGNPAAGGASDGYFSVAI